MIFQSLFYFYQNFSTIFPLLIPDQSSIEERKKGRRNLPESNFFFFYFFSLLWYGMIWYGIYFSFFCVIYKETYTSFSFPYLPLL